MPAISIFFGIVIRMFYNEHEQWAKEHEAEIRANWLRMKAGKPLEVIEPLR